MASTDLLAAGGDLDCSGYDLKLASGVQRVAQQVEIKLRSFLGDWFLDLDYGTPWFQRILGVKPANLGDAEAAIRAAALEVDGLLSVDLFELDYLPEERRARIRIQATSEAGPLDLTVEAP
jgi:hypothetical protein